MRHIILRNLTPALGTGFVVLAIGLAPASALSSVSSSTTTASSSSNSSTSSTASQTRLKLIISRGNNEITRRLKTLNTLSSKISATTKLSSSDKTSLTSEVTSEITNLTSLKTKLDADNDVTTAASDAQGIITDYRVYALVVPQVNLVKAADDQQVTEGKLTTLAGNLQTRLTTAQTAGKNIISLQSALSNLNSQVSAAQKISSNIETSVIGLQPSDYNTHHSVLTGDRNQLKTAQTDIQTATADAKTIVNGLKNL